MDFMAHIGQKLTLGMVGRFGRVFRLFQLGLGAFTLGDITIIPDATIVSTVGSDHGN